MDAALQTAFERGVSVMELNVAADNTQAISLYRRLGFEETMRSVDLVLAG
jgi:ribosomal protein S18 acetylase RimI-like enzyme